MTNSANIGKLEHHRIGELSIFHKNARRGDVDLIVESMKVNGVYKPLVVNRGTLTGRPNEVLAGNHSLMAIRRISEQNPGDPKWQSVDTYMVDLDDDAARKLVLVDNRSNDASTYDTEELLSLLTDWPDLDGTGFSRDEVDALLEAMDETEDEPTPEPEPIDTLGIIVECESKADMSKLKAELIGRGYAIGDA